MFLLAEILLVGVLLAEEETVLVVSGLLEKRGMIPPGSMTLKEGEALLLSGASLVIWYSWDLFSLVGWTRGIGSRTSGLCRFASVLIQQ